MDGPITNENYIDGNLIITINRNTLESGVFDDKSGNNNYGFGFTDYKPEFSSQTLKPRKIKTIGNFKTSKVNGAF